MHSAVLHRCKTRQASAIPCSCCMTIYSILTPMTYLATLWWLRIILPTVVRCSRCELVHNFYYKLSEATSDGVTREGSNQKVQREAFNEAVRAVGNNRSREDRAMRVVELKSPTSIIYRFSHTNLPACDTYRTNPSASLSALQDTAPASHNDSRYPRRVLFQFWDLIASRSPQSEVIRMREIHRAYSMDNDSAKLIFFATTLRSRGIWAWIENSVMIIFLRHT